MKTDTQHLDYLISQYVDGCLDPASRKSLEQKLVNDPISRQSYKEQRDVQDVLDDWGNRIPMIDWNDFDKKLATRLQHEVVGGGRVSIFPRWARPMAAAAALFVAASVGYVWHAYSSASPVNNALIVSNPSQGKGLSTPVGIEGANSTDGPKFSRAGVIIDEKAAYEKSANGTVPAPLLLDPPEDVAAANSLNDALAYGLQSPGLTRMLQSPGVARMGPIASPSAAGGTAMNTPPTDNKDRDEKEASPGFP